MRFTKTKTESFELFLTENEAIHASEVAESAGVPVPVLLENLLDSSLTCAHDALVGSACLESNIEFDGDGEEIPGIDEYGTD